LHTKRRKGGEAVFLEGVAVLTLLELEKDTRVLLVVLKRDLTTVSTTEKWRSCPSSLRGRRRRGPVQFPPDRRPAKPLADACCCASMQRSVASADIIVMEGWGRKG